MPKPRGRGMDMRVYVDSDHAGDTVTQRSRTGFVIFLNGHLFIGVPRSKIHVKQVLLVVEGGVRQDSFTKKRLGFLNLSTGCN